MRAVEALPPYRTCIVKQAVYVLELPTGAIRRSQTGKDDQRICSGQLQGNASAMGRAGVYHDPAS